MFFFFFLMIILQEDICRRDGEKKISVGEKFHARKSNISRARYRVGWRSRFHGVKQQREIRKWTVVLSYAEHEAQEVSHNFSSVEIRGKICRVRLLKTAKRQ